MLALPLLIGACDRRRDTGAVVVSAIGEPPAYSTIDTPLRDTASRLLIDATAQGLVRFDAAGQIEPGLAERWTVLDDGASYIFRLREAYWTGGDRVTAEQVVRLLRRRIAARANPLAPFLTAIDEIVVMTPQVIEIRLARPRPDLLKLFAQPDMALLRSPPPTGSGPLRIVSASTTPLLRPAFDPGRADPDDQAELQPEQDVRLIGERASRAILRFAARRSDLVSGGTYADWPLLAGVDLPRTAARIDPAVGLFGIALVRRDGFLADPANRVALSEAIDRTALVTAIAPGWDAVDRILPDTLDSAAPPQIPDWSLLTLDQRRGAARSRVAAWRGDPIRLRLALPRSSGATLLHGQLAASFATIGITLDRVDMEADADLRLIDAVAPYDSARWYLATACVACGDQAQQALDAARLAPTPAERGTRIAAADAALSADAGFIPIARPLRWSLVAPRLAAWQANSRAWHPLNRLRPDPT
ncbi:ABC transporter substrate-binding protein [Sphingomonas sp. Leaf339]|uniref:ABC transporter substrate-binding protein n=1 Tax=Sphingomonas sp. Leaf339 TaxID=1736343 RepID=UPI0006F59BAA|nr:ABC transporter substrate-binding protein [Sphingomonas sp. Leaf339]KQU61753.1 ABC transporter substrate-binding protein [Sphingomonas sp. Leaf339]